MSNALNSASSVRAEQYEMVLAYDRLARFPDQQAEAVAKHYAAHATVALQLLKLIEAREQTRFRGGGDVSALDSAIDYCLEQIKRNHRHDLGIELEWSGGENWKS